MTNKKIVQKNIVYRRSGQNVYERYYNVENIRNIFIKKYVMKQIRDSIKKSIKQK